MDGGWTALLLVLDGLYKCRPGILHLLRCGSAATGGWKRRRRRQRFEVVAVDLIKTNWTCLFVSLFSDSSRTEAVLELKRKHGNEWTAAFQFFARSAVDGRVRYEQHLYESHDHEWE